MQGVQHTALRMELGLTGLPVAAGAPQAQPSRDLGSCEPQHRLHGAHRGLWVDGEDSQDRRRAALLTILVQVQVVTWKDKWYRWCWQDLRDHARAGPCLPGFRIPPPPVAEPVAMAMLRQPGPEPRWDNGIKILPSSSESPYSVSPRPAARRHGVPGLHSQGQPQCRAGFGARAGVVPAHQRPLLLPGRAEHSRGDRPEGREGEQEAPGSASAFATGAEQFLSKHQLCGQRSA